MSRVAVASTSPLAAEAGLAIAELGGNAVDAAVASAMVSMVSEPGICSLGGGAFVTVWPDDGPPVTIDGNVAMPGDGVPERLGGGAWLIFTEYGGGVQMRIGAGTVAIPGALAALGKAVELYGSLPWAQILEPAIEVADRGFPLGTASRYYLEYVHQDIYGWDPASHAAIHDGDRLLEAGETVTVAGLGDALRHLAEAGADDFYRGELARMLVDDMTARDGLITATDLRDYRPTVRPALQVQLGSATIATNPPPAIGGVSLAAMLTLMGDRPGGSWSDADVARLIDVQRAVLGYRLRHVDAARNLEAAGQRLLDLLPEGLDAVTSAATVHTSSADAEGRGCAITASAGYGSGAILSGTGIWLNNCLGEIELNGRGFHALDAGERLASNMAPTILRDGADVVAIGSPGADRITTAIAQVLLSMVRGGMDMNEALAHPRVHVQIDHDGTTVGHEEDLVLPTDLGLPSQTYHRQAMFFGGVGVAQLRAGVLTAGADPRRGGATAVSQ